MKKVMRIFAVTAVVCACLACGNSRNQAKDNSEAVVAEECVADSAEVVRGEAQGFGRCLVSGCYCKEFEGRGETCRNCGHAYRKHY